VDALAGEFLKAFEGRNPVEVDPEDLETTHTMPFRLVDDKIVIQVKVNGAATRTSSSTRAPRRR